MSAARTGCGAGAACAWALQGGDGPDPAAGGHGGLLPANGPLRVVASGSDDLYQHRLAAEPFASASRICPIPGKWFGEVTWTGARIRAGTSPGPRRGIHPR